MLLKNLFPYSEPMYRVEMPGSNGALLMKMITVCRLDILSARRGKRVRLEGSWQREWSY
jgi:hypothetical protein